MVIRKFANKLIKEVACTSNQYPTGRKFIAATANTTTFPIQSSLLISLSSADGAGRIPLLHPTKTTTKTIIDNNNKQKEEILHKDVLLSGNGKTRKIKRFGSHHVYHRRDYDLTEVCYFDYDRVVFSADGNKKVGIRSSLDRFNRLLFTPYNNNKSNNTNIPFLRNSRNFYSNNSNGDIANTNYYQRCFSSSTTETSSNDLHEFNNNSNLDKVNENNDDDDEIILYQRIKTSDDTQIRSMIWMRSGLIFSCFHTTYWIWYTTDFIPLVNSSQHEYLHVDESIGYFGVLFAAAIQAVFFLYPKRLVSMMTWKPSLQKIFIYTHHLPWIRPSNIPSASFLTGTAFVTSNNKVKVPSSHTSSSPAYPSGNDNPIGAIPMEDQLLMTNVTGKKDVSISQQQKQQQEQQQRQQQPDRSLLDPTSEHAAYIVKEIYGDMTKFKGNLPIGYKWPYYLLDIQVKENVPEPELLLEALLRTQYMGNNIKEYDYDSNNIRKGRGNKSNRSTTLKRSGRNSGSGSRESQLRKITKQGWRR